MKRAILAVALLIASASTAHAQAFDYRGTGVTQSQVWEFRPSSTAPPVAKAGWGKIYYDAATNQFKISQNGSAWINLFEQIGGSGGVSSFNGRTGAVVGQQSDFSAFYGRLTAENTWTGTLNRFEPATGRALSITSPSDYIVQLAIASSGAANNHEMRMRLSGWSGDRFTWYSAATKLAELSSAGALEWGGGAAIASSANVGLLNATQTWTGAQTWTSTADSYQRIRTTSATGNAVLEIAAGNATTSSRWAYTAYLSSETGSQSWNTGMLGSKAYLIRDASGGVDKIAVGNGANGGVDISNGTGAVRVLGTGRTELNGGVKVGSSGANVASILSATTTWDPPSVAVGATLYTIITVPGATSSDVAYAAFTGLNGARWIVSAHVYQNDTVSVVIFNGTSGPQDLASGTLRVTVIKH